MPKNMGLIKIIEGKEIPRIIEMNEDLTERNDRLAEENRKLFDKYGVIAYNVVGSIGSGKTTIISRIAEYKGKKRIYVVCGDVTTRIDADRIQKHGVPTLQINTGRECALNAYHIRKVIRAIPLDKIDIVIIENVGNLICPSDFKLGTHRMIMVVSIAEGDHVIIKHPLLVKMADILIINKIDLLEVLGTDLDRMIGDAKKINPKIEVIPLSAKTGENFDKLLKFMELQ